MDRLRGKKVVVLVDEGFEDLEFWVTVMRLREEGASVAVAGTKRLHLDLGAQGPGVDLADRVATELAKPRIGRRRVELLQLRDRLRIADLAEMRKRLEKIAPNRSLVEVHGKMPGAELDEAMVRFAAGKGAIILATNIIETGLDVPRANTMIIWRSDRFGLAQLHQLRGRVGRGTGHSTCILLYQSALSTLARERLKIIYENTDGFEIAREDLRLRGPGELLGARQSGVPMLRFADLQLDTEWLDWARRTAPLMLDLHPEQAERHLNRWLGQRADFLKA